MDRVEQAKIIAKYMLDRVIPIYKENLHNDFNLDNETKEKLTKIYNRTNEEVLKTVLAKYQAKLLKQEENSILKAKESKIFKITDNKRYLSANELECYVYEIKK